MFRLEAVQNVFGIHMGNAILKKTRPQLRFAIDTLHFRYPAGFVVERQAKHTLLVFRIPLDDHCKSAHKRSLGRSPLSPQPEIVIL